jgi:hypothetical protein
MYLHIYIYALIYVDIQIYMHIAGLRGLGPPELGRRGITYICIHLLGPSTAKLLNLS